MTNRTGLCAWFRMRITSSTPSFFPASKPHASSGACSSTWRIISLILLCGSVNEEIILAKEGSQSPAQCCGNGRLDGGASGGLVLAQVDCQVRQAIQRTHEHQSELDWGERPIMQSRGDLHTHKANTYRPGILPAAAEAQMQNPQTGKRRGEKQRGDQ